MSMLCKCGAKTKCTDTRMRAPQLVTRRHQCTSCGARFSTKEIVVGATYSRAAFTETDARYLKIVAEKVFEIVSADAQINNEAQPK